MKIAISVFAKTPSLSPIKTRLAQMVGEEVANTFYIKSVAAVSENLKELSRNFNRSKGTFKKNPELRVYWALAEEMGVINSFWKDKSCLWTGEGSLGDRLYQVSQHLFEDHDYVFVMGTDSPQVGATLLQSAVEKVLRDKGVVETRFDFSALTAGKNKAIIGPCSDGGFYLFGMSGPLSRNFWTSITYSQVDTCQQLIENLEQIGFEVEYLPTFGDVDVIEDLDKLKRELSQLGEALNSKQVNLLEWLTDQQFSR